MKKTLGIICSACCVLITSCNNSSNGKGTVWDESRTTGSYNYARALWGNDSVDEGAFDPAQEDFIALNDEDLKAQFVDGAIPQPKKSPGEAGSGLPGIEAFHSPSGMLASVFKNLYFNTDDHILRDREDLIAIDKIADYLKSHPEVYIFVTGNADERGPEGYNLSLGARRANYIRTKLVEKGVDLNRVHTVSYGKERPVDSGHNQSAWAKNRRTEFKLYEIR